MELNAGTTILGRVELLREEPPSVGVQVFGPTWAVLDSESGELARACVLDSELLPDEASRAAFTAGLASLTNLRDPTLVPQLHAGADEHGGGVVYEPLPGGVAFDDLYDGTGSFELSAEVGRLARQLARALASLHAHGVVHGMLTSACVFVGPRGPAVYQYGLAPLCDRTVLLRRVRAFALPNLAPEVAAGGDFTPAADLYAWAVTVAQFAAGARGAAAIEAVHSGQELPGLGPALRSVLQTCLAEDPAGRPRDGSELLRLIELAGLGEGSGAVRPDELSADLSTDPAPDPAPDGDATADAAAAIAGATADAATATAADPQPVPEDSQPVPEDSKPAAAALAAPAAPAPSIAAAPIAAPPFAAAIPAMRSPPAARPPTIPPPRSSGPASAPTSSGPQRPGTIPPTGMTLPVTSFEEMLMTGDRQRRPGTIPPGSLQAGSAAPSLAPPPAPPIPTPIPTPAATASASSRIELSPEDLLNESGNWTRGGMPSGKSSSTLRRVRVLTDPLKRTGEISALTPVARAPEDATDSALTRGSDSALTRGPDSSLTRAPLATRSSPGDLIIGGTLEELEAASRATTVRLDPASAAAAVQAANSAAVAELERSSNALSELAQTAIASSDAAVSGPARPAESGGAPTSSSAGRRRSSAVSSSGHAEPRDWGTIPPLGPPLAPPSAPPKPSPGVAMTPAAPNSVDTTPAPSSKLIPILVLIALALLAIVFASS